jgi:ribonucrease Y
MANAVLAIGLVVVLALVAVLGFRLLSVMRAQTTAQPLDELRSLERIARAEADAMLGRAEREADLVRRSAEAEVAAQRRAAAVALGAERDAFEQDVAALHRRQTELAAARAELEQARAEQARALAESAAATAELRTARDALLLDRETLRLEADRAQAERVQLLESLGGLSAAEARAELLLSVEAGTRREAASLVRSIEAEARADGLQRARGIVAEAVQRVASEQTTETVVSVLHLPSDEMKGRIIGREGRNIRAFEALTGVNVIIDDTPEAVLLSCFDPVRRETGRITLERLVADGRIHPHRIEEVYEGAKSRVEELCLRAAHDALAEVGVTGIDDRLIPTLGRLKYRTSYGQNVLGHLVETAHLAGVMAHELGLDATLVKRAAFLHDIGKALTHEAEGSHAIVGAELLRRYGESETVAHAVEAHHNEVQPRTIEAVLTQAADTCSASRPGARRESLESYVKRLERIEQIASSRPGVERVFAMQAGHEVRVMVLPNEVDDLEAGVIAREVAKQIETELTYPGQIRVMVVRESRATEIAH